MIRQTIESLVMPPEIFIVVLMCLALMTIYKCKRIFLGLALCFTASLTYVRSIPYIVLNINSIINHAYQRQLPPKNTETAVAVLAGGWSKDEDGVPFQPSVTTMERLYAAVKLSKEFSSCKFVGLSNMCYIKPKEQAMTSLGDFQPRGPIGKLLYLRLCTASCLAKSSRE